MLIRCAAVMLMVVGAPVALGAGPREIALQSGVLDTSKRPALALDETAATIGKDKTRRFVIQLDGPMTPERRQRLSAAGVSLGEYLPTDAWVVTLDRANRAALRALDFVRWHRPFESAWKKSPETGRRVYKSPERREQLAAGELTLSLHLFAGVSADEVRLVRDAVAAQRGGAVLSEETVDGVVTIHARVPRRAADELAELSGVRFIEEAPEIAERNGTVRGIVQSNTPGVEPIYGFGLRGEGQVIGILDSAINVNHCSFSDVNPIGPLHRKILAYNAALGSGSHGTHVAGTAAGDNGNDSDTRGVAFMAKLVYGPIPSLAEATVFNSLTLHHNQGARIHGNSWGSDSSTMYVGMCRAVDSFAYTNEDDLVLVAVSNGGIVTTPENAKNCLSVSASQDGGLQDSECFVGGAGPTADGRRRPEVLAPGCDTFSAWSVTACDVLSNFGTSFATPAVAGCAALARQYYVDGFFPTGAPSPTDAFTPSGALLKATIINASVDMTGTPGFPSNGEGWGRVWLDQVLYFPGDPRRILHIIDVRNASGLVTGFSDEAVVEVGAGQPLKVTLVWTEPPATVGAAFVSINDLDLRVIAPGGQQYLGNVFVGGQSATGGVKDDRNNTEQVLLLAPQEGPYTVRVTGAAVNVGQQGYAVIVTGAPPPPPACPGDLDGSGSVGLGDVAIIITNWGTMNPAGDANGDGSVGLADIAFVIGLWETACP